MKQVLVLAFFLGIAGLGLYAQSNANQNQGPDSPPSASGLPAGPGRPAARGPNAQVTVTPGPQGPIVHSSAFGLSAPVSPQSGPPPGSPNVEAGAAETPAANPENGNAQPGPQPQKKAAPRRTGAPSSSPVHYDRAGRRVVDPDYTAAQMIQAEREKAGPETPAAAESPAAPEAAPGQERLRETVILVPGPALRRIQGILTVAKGMLALSDDAGVLWYLPGLDRYIGFIESLDVGEEAVLEGYAPPRGSSQERYFQATRLILDEMDYDLTIPPEGLYLGGQTTIIREIDRRRGAPEPSRERKRVLPGNRDRRDSWDEDDPYQEDWYDDERDTRPSPVWARRPTTPPRPAWEHNHKSPWAPPPSVMEFKMDYDSFWKEDEAKREQRERDSRELWY